MKYVKILQKNETHYNFTYQEGYNTELNFDPEIECDKGLHFCKDSYIRDWFRFGGFDGHYREVITSVNCVKGENKYKAKTIFVGPKQKFTEKMKLEALKENGCNLQYIKDPSEDFKLIAVKEHILAIQYIKDPSEQVCLEAVKQNGYAIEFIKNPTEEMKLEAAK